MSERYSVRDLARAQVDAARIVGPATDPDGARSMAFADALLDAFAALGTPDTSGEAFVLERLADDTVATLVGLRSPFASFLEAPPAIVDLYQRFGRPINEAIEQAASAAEDLLVELLTAVYGISDGQTVDAHLVVSEG